MRHSLTKILGNTHNILVLAHGVNGQGWGITSGPPLSAHLDFPRLAENENGSGAAAQVQSVDSDFAEE